MKNSAPMNGTALRLACGLAGCVLMLSLAGCKPSKRETHDVVLGVTNLHLTNRMPLSATQLRLGDDPFYEQHKGDLDQISDTTLRIEVPSNRSSRLRIGVYVSKDLETRLLATTKIADFNLEAGGVTPAEGTMVRVFNERSLRNLVLGEAFYLYVVGEADQLDVDIREVQLIVTAKFIV